LATPHGWRTAIAYADADCIVLRGHSLLDMIGKSTFAEAFLLAATGRTPTADQAFVLEAIMVAVIDHGIVPSSIVTRYLASCGTPLQSAVAGGVLAFGDTYGGAAQQLAQQMREAAAAWDSAEVVATAVIDHCAIRRQVVPGYGHPLHPNGDPRAAALLEIARKRGIAGRYVETAMAIEKLLEQRKGRLIALNADGAIGAIALDLGIDWRLVRALIFVPRSAGLAVHAVEEMVRESGWRHTPEDQVHYDGPPYQGASK
jgi:citrate synthase/citryl-CoA lyase